MTRTQKYTIVLMLTLFWIAVALAPILDNDFKPPPEINAAIPSLIGMILAAPAKNPPGTGGEAEITARRNEDGEDE